MNKRISRMKERLFQVDDRTVFWERVLALRRARKRYPGESGARLFALAFGETTGTMSVVIGDDDLIVGRPLEVLLSAEEEALLAGPYAEFFRPAWFSTRGHLTPAWDVLLQKGMLGLKREAEERIAGQPPDADGAEQRQEFWQAIADCCQAVADLSDRYADTAAAMARTTADPRRRAELLGISETCRRVPALPARSFREAVQSVWFLDFVFHTVCGARDYSLGRFDQYMLPYYREDIASGAIVREQALELVECLFVKANEIIGISDHYTSTTKRSLCRDSVQYVLAGGQTGDGGDATNDLSYLLLEATDDLRIKEPNLTVRYHAGIERDFWLQVCDAVRRGANVGLYNDEPVIASLVNLGIPLEEARGYVHYGCCNPHLPAQEPQLREYQHSLVKCLELALHNGRDPYPQKVPRLATELGEHSPDWPVDEVFIGPSTGELTDLKTFDDMIAAVKAQIVADVDRAVHLKRAFYQEDYLLHRPFAFESVLVHDCMERGLDINHGGARYVHHNDYAAGLGTIADSLVAIKKAVYEEGWLSLEELRDALACNFAGREELRLKLQSRYPKWGNDDDAVDRIAVEIAECFCQAALAHRDPVVGMCWPGIYSYHRFKLAGTLAGATPDGRLAGTPVSENQGPGPGRDRLGPTAMLSSLAKLPFHLTPGGGHTMALHPSLVSGPGGTLHLSELVETYFRMGGQHLQINIVNPETLRAAQQEPERYRGLTVRVTGYSAYFVTLDKQAQDILIASAEAAAG